MIKGFKAFDNKLQCRGKQFKVGETYKESDVIICKQGFHFCENVLDVYNYYDKSADTRICEIQALGKTIKEGDKSCTDNIKIIRELTHTELLGIWINNGNSGDGNSGTRNSGDWNSGNRNSGDWNSGDGNSGYGNSGNRNSGDWNSGDGNSGTRNSGDGNSGTRNSGDWNSGNRNSGYGNSGNRNSGDWNSGDGNSGYFNTIVPLYFFNKPTDIKWTQDLENKMRSLTVKPIVQWIPVSEMTEEEKTNNPSHKVIEGFIRKTNRHDWRYLTEQDKTFIKGLPGFEDEIFQQISGVSINDDIEVSVNGKTIKITKTKAKELGLID